MARSSNRPSCVVQVFAAQVLLLMLGGLACVAQAFAQGEAKAPTAAPNAAQVEALSRAQAAVIGISATAVDDAGSIATLGRERRGSGVVIGADGLLLTIGYLILEADHVDLLLDSERSVPARVLAYDLATGFGLLQPLAPLRIAPAPLGRSGELAEGEPVMIASGDGVSLARLVSRRAFSGYWEYHIDGALFTAPARSDHSGAALFNVNGELQGIGSLILSDVLGGGRGAVAGNMFVPVDLLKSVFDELRERGASRLSTRAWLGLNCVERDGAVRIVRVTRESPAEQAGLQHGDQIVAIDGETVAGLESFYKALWRDGAEREVKLDIRRAGEAQTLTARTRDRMKTLRRPQGI